MTETANGWTADEEDTLKDRYLTFRLGRETYGIGVSNVIEIIGIQAITEMPGLESYMKGIINLRGKIIPVMDVRIRFGKEQSDYTDRTCIIVINILDISIGLIVDSVSEVLSISEQEIVEPPKMNMAGQNFVSKIGKTDKDVLLLLDCDKLYSEDIALTLQENNIIRGNLTDAVVL